VVGGVINADEVILSLKAVVGKELLHVKHAALCCRRLLVVAEPDGKLALDGFEAPLVPVAPAIPPPMFVESLTTISTNALGSFNMLARIDTAFGPFDTSTETSLSKSSRCAFARLVERDLSSVGDLVMNGQ